METSPFSVDLVVEAKHHIQFLSSLHKNGVTLSKPSPESFRRYTELWLPMVMKLNSNGESCDLIPPADIAWLFHCHRLAPYRYSAYVQKRFFQNGINRDTEQGFKVVDASHPFVFQLEDNTYNDTLTSSDLVAICKSTIQHFQDMYPNENFFLEPTNAPKSSQTISTKLDGFDVLESCERQSTFLWQVSASTFSSDVFLKQGVDNYDKFVRLMGQKDRPRFIVPTYQIDLMWHTHMLSSIEKYHRDNMNMSGSVLEHDDSLNDRSEGSILNTNFQATRKLWKDVYGVEYKVPGGMYRGEPPKDFFRKDWVDKKGSFKPNVDTGAGLALSHLIGQIGASSHGKTTWLSIDDPIAFKTANPRSTTKGLNANPEMAGYVFGKGDKGIGYYNLNCRETYDVLFDRIENMLKKAKNDRVGGACCLALFCCFILIPCHLADSKKKIEELEDAKEFTRIKRDAAGPDAELDLPDVLKEKMSKYKRSDGGGGYYYDNTAYYGYAAACGAAGGYFDGGGGGDVGAGGAW